MDRSEIIKPEARGKNPKAEVPTYESLVSQWIVYEFKYIRGCRKEAEKLKV